MVESGPVSRISPVIIHTTLILFCHDSAADSTAIYQFFYSNSIIPVIDRNPRRKTEKQYDEKEHLNEDGVPVCAAGHPMIYHGYDPTDAGRSTDVHWQWVRLSHAHSRIHAVPHHMAGLFMS